MPDPLNPDKSVTLTTSPHFTTPQIHAGNPISIHWTRNEDKKKEGCDLRLGSKARLRARIEGFEPLTLKAQQTQSKEDSQPIKRKKKTEDLVN
ncbi:hypothetical protein Tco_0947012 [Tanacetum coccineum]